MDNKADRNRLASQVARLTLFQWLLAGISFILVLPFAWMLLTSFKPLVEVGLPHWWPVDFQWDNYRRVFELPSIQYGRWYWNSILVAACVTFVVVLTSAMAAFSFSRLEWPGRNKVFLLYLGTTMLPGLVTMIPNYQIMIKLGLVDSHLGLILPACGSAFGTFLLRQFMMTIPRSLDEAAEIDGASKWQVFWNVIMPLSRPGLITLSIFTFMGVYSSFFWPLVMLKTTHRYTLPIGLLFFNSEQGQETTLLMAAMTMAVAPVLAMYIFFQKHLVKGIQMGSVKG
jgi:ABC-type glycerol-3-phosphate transport system permease component